MLFLEMVRLGEQVLVSGNLSSSTNFILGILQNPQGGGWSVPVINIKISLRETPALPSTCSVIQLYKYWHCITIDIRLEILGEISCASHVMTHIDTHLQAKLISYLMKYNSRDRTTATHHLK